MLTDAQIPILRAAIAAETDATFVTLRSAGATGAMADWFNQPHASFIVWRTAVTKSEYVNEPSNGGAGGGVSNFNWTGNGYTTRNQGDRDAWREIFSIDGHVNPSRSNVQQAFADIFSGTGIAAANLSHILAASKRLAKRGERLFATGTGTTASPGQLAFEGDITNDDVVKAVGNG